MNADDLPKAWPSRSIAPLKMGVSERELDELKHRAIASMAGTRDRAILRARVVAETAYSAAHRGILACTTDEEVDRVQGAFNAAMIDLRRSIDAHDP